MYCGKWSYRYYLLSVWLDFYREALRALDNFFSFVYVKRVFWGRSEAGLSRWPVKPEIAGSSPVAPVTRSLVRAKLLVFLVALFGNFSLRTTSVKNCKICNILRDLSGN